MNSIFPLIRKVGAAISVAAMTLLVVMVPVALAGGGFDDVPPGHMFYDEIYWLVDNQITSGCSSTPPLYCPDAPVSRGQMAVFLYRLAGNGAAGPIVDADTLDGNHAVDFAPANHSHMGEYWAGEFYTGLSVTTTGTTEGQGALRGIALGPSPTTSYGVYGESHSFMGYGGYFVNEDGGVLIAANDEVPSLDVDGLEFMVDNDGDVFADGAYHCGSDIPGSTSALYETTSPPGLNGDISPCLVDNTEADFAEMVPVVKGGALGPGDLLVVDSDGKLAMSTRAYQSNVVGVYSTRPSYLGNSNYRDVDGYAPLALLGIVPVKASAENGAIQAGDLLVASDTPGHAMRAGEDPPQGAVVGKALGSLKEGQGVIRLLVTLQ
jgi:hypothetical protein